MLVTNTGRLLSTPKLYAEKGTLKLYADGTRRIYMQSLGLVTRSAHTTDCEDCIPAGKCAVISATTGNTAKMVSLLRK